MAVYGEILMAAVIYHGNSLKTYLEAQEMHEERTKEDFKFVSSVKIDASKSRAPNGRRELEIPGKDLIR